MAENLMTSGRTKHVDIWNHYVPEFVEDGFVNIIFGHTAENYADRFTQNVTGNICDAYVQSFLLEKENI
jgi:hypothetical protein